MVDPVGAPTFAQMFSPTKSPFHAISLFALICLYTTLDNKLLYLTSPLSVFVITVSFLAAPFFRPSYEDREYNLSLLYGRTAGIIGGLIAITLLAAGSVPTHIEFIVNSETSISMIDEENFKKFSADSPLFNALWISVICHCFFWIAMFFFRCRLSNKNSPRYNILQFSLMQSTLLIFLIAAFTKIGWIGDSIGINQFKEYLLNCVYSFAWIFRSDHPMDATSAAYCLFSVWGLFFIINIIFLLWNLRLGWITDHGDGVTI